MYLCVLVYNKWIKFNYMLQYLPGIAQPVQRLTKLLTVRGSNPGMNEIFRTRVDPSRGPQSLLSVSKGSLSWR